MNVCFIIGAMNYSGAEKVLSMVMDELVKLNHKVSVVLLEKEYGESQLIDGINVYGAKSSGNRIKRLFCRWKYIRTCVKTISPDVVVSFGFVCNINSIVSLINQKCKLVICERNDPNFDPRKKTEKIERNILYRFADGYVFQTNEIHNYFEKIIGEKDYAIIPNPIVDSNIRWNIQDIEKRIVSVARLDDYQKDQYIMFEAFRLFHEKYPDYILELYGAGPDEEEYRSYLSNRNLSDCIKLKGKSQSPLKDIRTATLFLLTSRFEGMPNALMEALSIGIPCVSTNCGGGGAKYLLNICDCNEGLVEVGNVLEIANKLEIVLNDVKLLNSLSINGLQINSKLERSKIVQQWVQFLLKIQRIS